MTWTPLPCTPLSHHPCSECNDRVSGIKKTSLGVEGVEVRVVAMLWEPAK